MSSSSLLFFFFYASAPLRHLHSFPTRRSSDLDVPLHVTVVGGVAVDDDRLGAARLGFLHFEAAEHLAIAHDDDTPLHRQPQRLEPLEILVRSIVDIDNLPRRLARGAVAVEPRKRVLAVRRLVADVPLFAER